MSEKARSERHFVIAGEDWTVREDVRDPRHRCLLFVNSKVARRVRDYPANWFELPDEKLYALSWSR